MRTPFYFFTWTRSARFSRLFALALACIAIAVSPGPARSETPGLQPSQRSDLYHVSIGGEPLTVYVSRPPAQRLCNSTGCDGADHVRSDQRSLAWTNFSFVTPTNVVVGKMPGTGGTLRDIQVRPSSGLGVDFTIVRKDIPAGEIEIRVIMPNSKLSVEYIDDRYDAFRELPKDGLLVFADQDESLDDYPPPDKSAPDVYVVAYGSPFNRNLAAQATAVYFEPGVHNLGYWEVPASVMHVYLADGAYVLGAINSAVAAKRTQAGFRVTGRGVLSGEAFPWRADKRSNGLQPCRDANGAVYDCWFDAVKLLQVGTDKFFVQGVTFANAPHWVIGGFKDTNIAWNAHDANGNDDPLNDPLGYGLYSEEANFSGSMSNVKVLGNWRWNNDGIGVLRNTAVKDCFVSAFDDAFKLFNNGGSVRNCVVWQMDNGSVFQLGWFAKGVTGLAVQDIDVMHAEWTGLNQNWGLVNFADRGWNGSPRTIENSSFKDVRIEGPATRVVGLENRVITRQSFRNLTFENVRVDHLVTPEELIALAPMGNGAIDLSDVNNVRPPNIINDASAEATITGIVFRNFVIDDQLITAQNAQTVGQFAILGASTQVSFNPPPPGC